MEYAISFTDILKVPNVVFSIANSLNAQDYLVFKRLNKDIYGNHLTKAKEDEYWSSKLKRIGLTATAPLLTDDDKQWDSSNIFDILKTFEEGNPKKTYERYYKVLNPFIKKLYYNDLSNFFPAYLNDPLSQAKTIKSIELFNKSNDNDWDFYKSVVENLKIFKELFVNSVINELTKRFQKKDYVSSTKFVQVLLLLDYESSALAFFKSENEFSRFDELPDSIFDENENLMLDRLTRAIETFTSFLNDKISLVDILFEKEYPVMVLFTEEFIQEQMINYFKKQLEMTNAENKENGRLSSLPTIYEQISLQFVEKLKPSSNAGPSYKRFTFDFIQLYFESEILKFFDLVVRDFSSSTEFAFHEYQREMEEKQKQKDEALFKSYKEMSTTSAEIIDEKTNFLKAFTKVFKINNNTNKTESEQNLEILYNLQKMNMNLQNITSLISLDLCYKVIQNCKENIEKIRLFMDVAVLTDIVKKKCQDMFKTLLQQLSENHIKIGFENALQLLKDYDANDTNLKNITTDEVPENTGQNSRVVPLLQFTELINIGDIILQMISIFYSSELISKGIIDKNRDFLNDIVQSKKSFETMLDDYVADGLNIGIDKLMDQVQFVFNTMQFPDDFNPDPKTAMRKEIKPSRCAVTCIQLLSEHCFLLTGATDKGTIDVFQQEVAERFFDQVVKNIKKNLVSEDGAVFLIADLNYYYDFVANSLRQKNIIPFFAGLKSVGQLYLVSGKDSKELGKMICDVGKFQGVFTQEEIFELVQRRTDWVRVRKDVEKAMYGLGISDCLIA